MVDSLAFYFADVVKKRTEFRFLRVLINKKCLTYFKYVKHFVLICTASGTIFELIFARFGCTMGVTIPNSEPE